MTDPATSFDAVSATYDAARPSYPAASVEWIVPPDAVTVVDVGAGTGKFTRLLARPGRRVIAVEPSAGMLAELRRELPRVEAWQGTGERMPLPDASADAVTFAQSWHWVDVSAACREVSRVLRPGGTLGLVWNLRDERIDWVRALGRAMRADGDHFRGEDGAEPDVAAPFAAPSRSYVEWTRVCPRDEVLADVRSRSYFALLSEQEQRDVLAEVSDVIERRLRRSGDDDVRLPYVTAAFRYDLA